MLPLNPTNLVWSRTPTSRPNVHMGIFLSLRRLTAIIPTGTSRLFIIAD